MWESYASGSRRCRRTHSRIWYSDVLYAMGYGDGTEDSRVRTGRSGDAGIDGLIREDRLGLDSVYVQAKRWQGTVGREVV